MKPRPAAPQRSKAPLMLLSSAAVLAAALGLAYVALRSPAPSVEVEPVRPPPLPVEPVAVKPVEPKVVDPPPPVEPVEPSPKPVEPSPKPVEPSPKPVEPSPKPVEPSPRPPPPKPVALTAAIATEVIKRGGGEVRACITKHLTDLKDESGALVVELVVNRQGTVTEATMVTSGYEKAAVTRCVLAAARRLSFPRNTGDKPRFKVPFTYSKH